MEVFSKSYLEEVVENQGKLFEYAEEHWPGMDVADFIEAYMKSHTRAMIDKGQPYVCTMDAENLFEYFLEYEKYEPKPGKAAGGFAPNWIGQFYALFQWVYGISSKEVLKLLPTEFMFAAYPGAHDLDLYLAVHKVGEQCGLKAPENSGGLGRKDI
ncbi:MAG TPA: hypothetical protein IAB98_02275 [Candidatus Egerieimonas intestinavium]|uniref:Uncharacterized protein n=1 Tax=Candidatus Egerieimonas intestinavium TaxID=2840777 RepID=A0A9D1EIL3_9FIRM|nr:hypothetical protein [Candidatus Egerieimonas intestinavium]